MALTLGWHHNYSKYSNTNMKALKPLGKMYASLKKFKIHRQFTVYCWEIDVWGHSGLISLRRFAYKIINEVFAYLKNFS